MSHADLTPAEVNNLQRLNHQLKEQAREDERNRRELLERIAALERGTTAGAPKRQRRGSIAQYPPSPPSTSKATSHGSATGAEVPDSFLKLQKDTEVRNDEDTCVIYWEVDPGMSGDDLIETLASKGVTIDKNAFWKVKRGAREDKQFAVRIQKKDQIIIKMHITEIVSKVAYPTSEEFKEFLNRGCFVLVAYKIPFNLKPATLLESLAQYDPSHITWKRSAYGHNGKPDMYTAYIAIARLPLALDLHNAFKVTIKEVKISAALLRSNFLNYGRMLFEGRNPPSIQRYIDAPLRAEFAKFGVEVLFWVAPKTASGDFERKLWVSAKNNATAARYATNRDWLYADSNQSLRWEVEYTSDKPNSTATTSGGSSTAASSGDNVNTTSSSMDD